MNRHIRITLRIIFLIIRAMHYAKTNLSGFRSGNAETNLYRKQGLIPLLKNIYFSK